MSTPALNPLVTKIRAMHPGAYDDLDDAALTKAVLAKYPQYSDLAVSPVQKPAIAMQPQPLGFGEKVGANLADAAAHVADVGKGVSNDVYDTSTPNIATQIYRKLKGLPNTLDKIPEKMVTGFFSASGLPESEAVEPTVAAEAGAAKAAPEAAAKSAAAAIPEVEAMKVKSPNLEAPRTLSGESALGQILTGQDNANLLKIARSRGIDVSQEAQLKPGAKINTGQFDANGKPIKITVQDVLIQKIIDDFAPDEIEEVRATAIENGIPGRLPGSWDSSVRRNMDAAHPQIWNKVGAEANKTLALQTYFPDVKIPKATIRRTQMAVSAAASPEAAGASDLTDLLKASVKLAKKKKLVDLAGAAATP